MKTLLSIVGLALGLVIGMHRSLGLTSWNQCLKTYDDCSQAGCPIKVIGGVNHGQHIYNGKAGAYCFDCENSALYCSGWGDAWCAQYDTYALGFCGGAIQASGYVYANDINGNHLREANIDSLDCM